MQNHKKQTYDRGVQAEKLAALWLWLKGYKILERRYKTPVGEIDLIIRKKSLIAFVEVKARMTRSQALESLTPDMRRRINRAASHYISHNNINNCDLRFDLVSVTRSFLGTVLIHHLDNAWDDTA